MAENVVVKGRKGKRQGIKNLKPKKQLDVNKLVVEEVPTGVRAEAL